jgi:epoxyqueuosine reductase
MIRPPVVDSGASQVPLLGATVRAQAQRLGFSAVSACTLDLSEASVGLRAWLAEQMHGEMHYLQTHAHLRLAPQQLVPGAVTAIMLTMPYVAAQDLDQGARLPWEALNTADNAYVSVYARGRDYHKVVRQRLAQLAKAIALEAGPMGYRVFCDSAPVMEVELARKAGLGWRGKHTLLLNREAGSLFFLGSIYCDIPLARFADLPVVAAPAADGQHCGTCTKCIEVCPTQAIVAPYRLDARRCISYLTIELKGSIPEPLRPLIGNRVLGCDDCQLACPWNKFAQSYTVSDFSPREQWNAPALTSLFAWSEDQFLHYTEGSAIRRIGHAQWQRNLAVALGNAAAKNGHSHSSRQVLNQRLASALCADPANEAMVREHVQWALAR